MANHNRLEAELRTIPGIGNVTSSAGLQSPEITITPNLAEAASLGVTTSAISEAIRVATSGAYDIALSNLNLPERQVPIRVMLDEHSRQTELLPNPRTDFRLVKATACAC